MLKTISAGKHRLNGRVKAPPAVLKVDLACGQTKQPGHVGIDVRKLPGVDIVHNLDKIPWPLKDASVAEVFCSHYIEHTADLIGFMEEVHRILVPGGKMTVIAPYYTSIRAWQDPTHKRAIGEATFLYFNKGWRDANKLNHYPITTDFDFTYGYVLMPEFATRNPELQQFAIAHYWNVVADIHVTLTKRVS